MAAFPKLHFPGCQADIAGTEPLDKCTGGTKTRYTSGFPLIGPLTATDSCAAPHKLIESLPKFNGRNSNSWCPHAQPEEHQPRPAAQQADRDHRPVGFRQVLA